ncbi:hypothetical protein F2P45_15460 [Massilia sp. CCM 8733]|uniref:Uncharacterized protein n=1 Tax=Massilia mucilaginosa TaxID=2609282 RepID=A0ABX0NUQ1_9BURK|nr:hypothetical protein [Massilia mucilaginosa]
MCFVRDLACAHHDDRRRLVAGRHRRMHLAHAAGTGQHPIRAPLHETQAGQLLDFAVRQGANVMIIFINGEAGGSGHGDGGTREPVRQCWQEYLIDHLAELLSAVGKGVPVMKEHGMIPFNDRIFSVNTTDE